MSTPMYEQMIREAVARMGRIGSEPRHIEAWMRLEHGCLDGLGGVAGFQHAVGEALACVDAAEAGASERLTLSYGL